MRVSIAGPGGMALVMTLAMSAPAQEAPNSTTARKPAEIFRSETPLAATFTANIGRLKHDRAAKAPWRTATLTYPGADSQSVTVPLQARTRGIWRLKKCEFPPLRLNFSGDATRHTIFRGLDKPKLVNYCRNDDTYEQYIIQELQLYRIYNLLTPASHRARLVRLTYADSASGKVEAVRFAFFLEEPAALAARLAGRIIDVKGATPNDLDPYSTALVGVFAYMIGNTDLSINGLHNAELLGLPDGTVAPMLYDFDFSGAVNARYALPDTSLRIKRVRDRQFRGFCVERVQYDKVFGLLKEKKDAIYALYRDEIGRLLTPRIVEETLKYFDDFYQTIGDPSAVNRRMLDDCIRPPPG